MPSHANTLRRLGHPATRGRAEILRVLSESPIPLSPREIRARIPDPKPDLSTVYRAVSFLAAAGIARAVALNERGRRFEASLDGGHRHRAVCRACGRIESFSPGKCAASRMESALRKRLGFFATDHSLEFFGTCRRCAAGGKSG